MFKFESEWAPEQSERAKILFEIFPEIEKAYKIIKKFRIFYQINPTHALAESINNKIQRFLINNHGTRDSHFFFFRINNLLT